MAQQRINWKKFREKFGDDIRTWRVARELSQQELAKRAEVSQPHLSKIERGVADTTLVLYVKLCRALQISVDRTVSGVLWGVEE